ncbi:MAG: hypothetical protein M1824_003198 [Vezdaea acicularis]|nr:MAG: hypothetical protein M1824_003198 [Vezdaea acicularis]
MKAYTECTQSPQFDFATFHAEEPEFWMEFPNLLERLLRRRIEFRGGVYHGQCIQEQKHLSELVEQIGRIASKHMQLDVAALGRLGLNEEPDPCSIRLVRNVSLALSPEIPLYATVAAQFGISSDDLIIGLATDFALRQNVSGTRLLTQYLRTFLDCKARSNVVDFGILYAVELTTKLVEIANSQYFEPLPGHGNEEVNLWHQLLMESVALFRAVDEILRNLVDKQTPALSKEFSDMLVHRMEMLAFSIGRSNDAVVRSFAKNLIPLPDEVLPDSISIIISQGWKFSIYKKYIMNGRMEVRSNGVDSMARTLVDMYKGYNQSNEHKPILAYIADLILDNKLVQYIVGVDSHPELISQSANIIGFLAVTGRYTSAETDAIWIRIGASQDLRAVAAILPMLKSVVGLLHYSDLLYLCEKVYELPMRSFDGVMRDFTTDLLRKTRDKHIEREVNAELDSPPYDLCIKLIREAATDGGPSQDDAAAVYQFALAELKELVAYGPSEPNREIIYQDCMKHIEEKTPSATGSICAINTFLSYDMRRPERSRDMTMLTEDFNLTQLLVEEFSTTVEHERSKTRHTFQVEVAMATRIELIGHIIAQAPSTITPELGDKLWKFIVGDAALGSLERDRAWMMLCDVSRRTTSRNVFLDRCIDVYIPHVPPECFTKGTLSYTQQTIEYLVRHKALMQSSEHQIIELPGAEQLWKMVLNSPPGTIENEATDYLVKLSLDISVMKRAPKSAIEATHVAIVERCIRQLMAAASKLKAFSDGTTSGDDEPMVVVTTEAEILKEELNFSRSLVLLREFLGGMKARPQYHSPQTRTIRVENPIETINGSPITIRYQSFAPGSQSIIQEFVIGDLQNLEDLHKALGKVTGFSQFTTIMGGCQVDLLADADALLQDKFSKNPLAPLILVRKVHDPNEPQQPPSWDGLTAVELELLKQFDQLYDLMGLEEKLAKEIWQLLVSFPVQEQVRRAVLDPQVPYSQVFPAGQPFKSLYSTHTLLTCLDEHRRKGSTDEAFMTRGTNVLTWALTGEELFDGACSFSLKVHVANQMLNCLIRFIKEPVSHETLDSCFADAVAVVNRLITLIEYARSSEAFADSGSTSLAAHSFSALVEISMRNRSVWTLFITRADSMEIVRLLLLVDTRQELRHRVMETIRNVCGYEPPAHARVQPTEFARFFWEAISAALPDTTNFSNYCSQFFDAASEVFTVMIKDPPDDLRLGAYISIWGDLLVSHEHHGFVGRESTDYFVLGLTRLLICGVQHAKALKQRLATGDLAERLLNALLFPQLSRGDEQDEVTEKRPILDEPSRKELYRLVYLLAHDLEHFERILDMLADLVPEDYAYILNFNFDRSKAIRSSTGYVGLRNLSNTCYLNSLFTQLYMNVKFREFMLGANVADAEGSQKLLSETKKLFAFMQDSWEKAVEPIAVTDNIRTYDNEPIDVAVQMDVDEFYNLLFDRWESQILSTEAKITFRSFYGGQLVQQVRSKECQHISEREEPFSAIQCDIKGKTNLAESLKAYVEGETMEGDNKYSCTSCSRHVDAVKRTCLKEVPDNLIFHLKRFDFDLRTMQRNKINDRFEFPSTIDMKPYKIDHLSSPTYETPQDWFELVGVLVHSGTAESGHYYSFIKERPSTSSAGPTWVEFNDSDVTYFDPNNIPSHTFGGQDDMRHNSNGQKFYWSKNYSAYMLFYQRCSAVQAQQQEESVILETPKKIATPVEIRSHIALENELLIRKYCLYDPAHVPFIKTLLDSLRYLNKGVCSDDHGIEGKMLRLALDHLDQVIVRTKDQPDFDAMMTSFTRVMTSCEECCSILLDWVVGRAEAMRNILLRSPQPKTRQDFSHLIITALRYLRQKDPQRYGLEIQSTNPTTWQETQGALQLVLGRLDRCWTNAIEIHLRAWDEYFGILIDLAKFGVAETLLVLRRGFLNKILEVLIFEVHAELRLDYDRLNRQLLKGRKPSYINLIGLLQVLLDKIDLTLEPVIGERRRLQCRNRDTFPLTRDEAQWLKLRMTRTKTSCIISKMLDLGHNMEAAKQIIAQICLSEPPFGILLFVQRALTSGMSIDPASLAGPYLQGGIVFCENAPDAEAITELIHQTSKDVETIGSSGGKEHLAFYQALYSCRNELFVDDQPWFFREQLLENLELWAPHLLLYWEPEVRDATLMLVNRLVLEFGPTPGTGSPDRDELIVTAARKLCIQCISILQSKYVELGVGVTAKTLEATLRVIEMCIKHFDEEMDLAIYTRKEVLLESLKELLIEEEVEDNISEEEWADDSAIASDSDVEPLYLPKEGQTP